MFTNRNYFNIYCIFFIHHLTIVNNFNICLFNILLSISVVISKWIILIYNIIWKQKYTLIVGSPIIYSDVLSSNIADEPLLANATTAFSTDMDVLLENVTFQFRDSFNKSLSTIAPMHQLTTILWKENITHSTSFSTLNHTMAPSTAQVPSRNGGRKLIITTFTIITTLILNHY